METYGVSMMSEIFLGQGLLGQGQGPVDLLLRMANRHGLIAGATGTGKTVTLKVLAEGFSKAGVPVFMADVKGDLAGISQAGATNDKIAERVKTLGITPPAFQSFPVMFWDLFGEQGHPVRTTVSELGPMLLSRLLQLNEVQSGVLQIVFKVADDNGLLLLDLKDLRAVLQHVGENAKDYTIQYGNVSTASIGAIQRGILALSEQGGEAFFGEPALDIQDLIQTDTDGRGFINILASDKLLLSPMLYSTFLLWLLSELFEELPEVGDVEKPKLVFFFDEAHLLFDDAPKSLVDKIEQVVRLIRSKGVGVYFVSQSPLDITDTVLGQLGNRVQHALRAFTPRDQKAVRAAAETFRNEGPMDVEEIIGQLAIGEALVSFLDDKGSPTSVQRVLIAPPASRIGPVTVQERQATMTKSLVANHYEKSVDRESAFELLKSRALARTSPNGTGDVKAEKQLPSRLKEAVAVESTAEKPAAGRARQGPIEAFIVSAARSVGSQMGRQVFRGILGSILGGRRR